MNKKILPNSLSSSQLNEVNRLLDYVSKRQCSDFGNIQSELKPDGTLITTCDRWSDETIVRGLGKITKDEGVLSEEGDQLVPSSAAYWVVDPLDGTTNFASGIPYWAISIARFVEGRPQCAFLDVPALNQRIVAIRGKGVWRNGKPVTVASRLGSISECISLCSRSIRVLQRRADKPFPGKIRLLGVASLNLVSVAMGQTVGALEATPKIWDLASPWLVLSELQCPLRWLDADPANLSPGQDLSLADFPVLAASSNDQLKRLLPWGEALMRTCSLEN